MYTIPQKLDALDNISSFILTTLPTNQSTLLTWVAKYNFVEYFQEIKSSEILEIIEKKR